MPLFSINKHSRDSILPSISGKLSSLLQPLRESTDRDLDPSLVANLVSLEHPLSLNTRSLSRNPTESSTSTKLVQSVRSNTSMFGLPDKSGTFCNSQPDAYKYLSPVRYAIDEGNSLMPLYPIHKRVRDFILSFSISGKLSSLVQP